MHSANEPRRRAGLILAIACLAVLGPAGSLSARPVEIRDVRLGLPGVREGQRWVRPGAWAPVHVELQAGGEDVAAGELELMVQTQDSDDVQTQLAVPVPALRAEERQTVRTYYLPGNRTASLTASVRRKDGAVVHAFEKSPELTDVLNPEEVLYLTAGAKLSGLRYALLPEGAGPKDDDQLKDEGPQRGIALARRAGELPAKWFGYAGVDVVVLGTGDAAFIKELLARSPEGRADTPIAALGEWVRRGGRLVIGAGRNYRDAAELLRRLGIRSFELGPPERRVHLREIQEWTGHVRDRFPGTEGLAVARLRLKDGAMALVRDRQGEESWPVVALAPCGLGRVLLVAFDLDAPALAGWKGRGRFWEAVHGEVGPRLVMHGKEHELSAGDRPGELATALQRGLETFSEAPAVSFGWVAFFILVYILLIGPLDYLFLKKVVKRLELTWVTFPLVVLVSGLAAYYTAAALKGDDLRVNKIDVVDIDLRSREVRGTTLFSLFSPRVQAYTLGIEPAWVTGDGAPVVTKMSPPDNSAGGVNRPGSAPLFRRPYTYADGAAGLQGVPVPVWAARSFRASWRAHLPDPRPGEEDNLPIKVEDFGLSRDGLRLIGRIHNRLPMALRDVSLFYNGKWHQLDDIPANGYYRIDGRDILRGGSSNVTQWMDEPFDRARRRSASEGLPRAAELPAPAALMKSVLFHAQEGGPYSHLDNSGLRLLDQGWRLRGLRVVSPLAEKQYLNEAILVGRAVRPSGDAEAVSKDGASPTRLWLGRLPGEGDRPPLKGYLRQETYVRFYIPIQNSQ